MDKYKTAAAYNIKRERYKEYLKSLGPTGFINQMAEETVMRQDIIRDLRAQVAAAQNKHIERLFKGKPIRRVIIYENRKSGKQVYPETMAGYMALFKYLDRDLRVYGDLTNAGIRETQKDVAELQALEAQRVAHTIPKLLLEDADKRLRGLDMLQRQLASAKANREDLLAARQGNAAAVKRLLSARHDYEYEEFTVEAVQEA